MELSLNKRSNKEFEFGISTLTLKHLSTEVEPEFKLRNYKRVVVFSGIEIL